MNGIANNRKYIYNIQLKQKINSPVDFDVRVPVSLLLTTPTGNRSCMVYSIPVRHGVLVDYPHHVINVLSTCVSIIRATV